MDFDRIQRLLEVVREARLHPHLKPIHDKAMGELEKHAKGEIDPPRYGRPEGLRLGEGPNEDEPEGH